MFRKLGQFATTRSPLVFVAWGLLLVAMLLVAPKMADVQTRDDASLLPPDVPSRIAIAAQHEAFEKPPAMSVAAIIFKREGGLTGVTDSATSAPAQNTDYAYLARLTRKLQAVPDDREWDVFSPADPKQPFLRSNLLAPPDKPESAVIKVDLPTNFVSAEAIGDVDRIEQIIRETNPPEGLNWAITGSASFGRDYFTATQRSLDRTTWVTIVAVIVVLLLTYRALLAAAISLLTVTAAVVVSLSLLAIGAKYGWSVSMIVELFTIVIGYGAGVDFSLFFLARYHEELGRSVGSLSKWDRRHAVMRALVGTGPAIVASAATVAAGLLLMYLADFKAFSNAGPAVALSVVVSCIASLTLTPAMGYLFGRKTFWPRRIGHDPNVAMRERRGFWNRLSHFTVSRPLLILLLGIVVLTPLAIFGWQQEMVYDTLADLPASNHSVRGAAIFREHFPVGEMAPIHLMVSLDEPLSEEKWIELVAAIDHKLTAEWQSGPGAAGIQDVRSLVHPLGAARDLKIKLPLVGMLHHLSFEKPQIRSILAVQFNDEVKPRHLSSDLKAARWDIAIDEPSYSNRALATLAPLEQAIRQAATKVLPEQAAGMRVLMAGDSAQMRDVQRVTHRDFWIVGAAVVLTIILIVVLLIRDVAVAVFVMLATILSYGAALGLTTWIFQALYGIAGPDWKVEFFLFVILVAVGQDYNLFILTRIREEHRTKPLRPATESAIARTGAIISCCGLIMAATLGSLASTPLRLLQELGVAFIIGLLFDTFLVRPLMVPAFALMFRRLKHRPSQKREADDSY